MRPVSARPNRKPDYLEWTRVGIDPGKELKGWLAGPAFGVEGHSAGAFKPCHRLFTNGLKVCPWCAIPQYQAIRFQGYLPLYDERLKRTVVCVNLDTARQTDDMKPLTPIILKKGRAKNAPITMSVNQWIDLKPSGRTVSPRAVDILPWLVMVLWKQENLSEVVDCLPQASDVVQEHMVNVAKADQPEEEKPADIAAAKALLARRRKQWAKDNDQEQPADAQHEGNGPRKKRPE